VRLLERESQLAALTEYAGEAAGGHGRLVLLSGEAGVGKSTLVEQLQDSSSATYPGTRWYWGACDGLFTPRPLGPLHDIASSMGGVLAQAVGDGASRDGLFATALEQIADPRALTVWVVEDVHWADEATLDLLRYLGRRIRDVRALIVATFRDEALGSADPLRIALGELSTQRTTRRLTLGPLSPAAVAELVEGTELEPEQMYELTGGNPFYLDEVLRHGPGELPTSARDAVLAHVATLSPGAREVLDTAALIGARVDPQLLRAATQEQPETIDEIVTTGLLTSEPADEGPGRLRFRHEIARRAVEQASGVHRRGPLHERILTALEESGSTDDAQLAFHAEGAVDAGRVLAYAPEAARRSARLGAHREAAAQYERAVRFAADAELSTRAALYEALAKEFSFVDRWPEAAAAMEQALDMWREVGDPFREGALLLMQCKVLWRLCRGDESAEAGRRAIELLEPLGSSPELARALQLRTYDLYAQGRREEALAGCIRVQRMAEEHDLPDVLAESLNDEGCIRADLHQEWRPLLERALRVAVDAEMQAPAGRAYANAYTVFSTTLRFADGERTFQDGVTYCDDHDIDTYGRCLRGERSIVLNRMGRWDEATTIAETLISAEIPSSNRMNPLHVLGRLRARSGQDGVWRALDESVASADGLGEMCYVVPARLARAEARWLEGDAEAARDELHRADVAAKTCSDFERAEAAVWRLRITGSSDGVDVQLTPYAIELSGRGAEAASAWDALNCPYDAALALLGSTDEAHLREAVERLDRLGAVTTARLARQRMRDLGIRSVPAGARAATRAHPAGLTPREREVLDLICEGRTNEEISGRLFISVKTVDHHVSAVLGKLGVQSRKLAAAEAARRGLVGTA
jgi:DNA-binding CsgD family transcriptional regulator/tetratricopeptide (TPR) repeat protein